MVRMTSIRMPRMADRTSNAGGRKESSMFSIYRNVLFVTLQTLRRHRWQEQTVCFVPVNIIASDCDIQARQFHRCLIWQDFYEYEAAGTEYRTTE